MSNFSQKNPLSPKKYAKKSTFFFLQKEAFKSPLFLQKEAFKNVNFLPYSTLPQSRPG